MKITEQKLREIIKEELISLNEAKGFKNTTDFEKFLIEIDGMGDSQIKKIMGKDYIDTPGFYQDEKEDYDDVEDFMRSNMGDSEFEELESWWENNVAESVVTEGETLKKGDIVKFKDGRSIYIVGPKGDGYDYKDGREIGHHPKGWFDMMISTGKAVIESVVTEGFSTWEIEFEEGKVSGVDYAKAGKVSVKARNTVEAIKKAVKEVGNADDWMAVDIKSLTKI